MAKGKNEILLSIALEGDQDVKSKLKAVGDEGKKSLAEIEKRIGRAGDGFGRSLANAGGAPVAKLREALAPLTEASGVGGLLGSLGAGGLFSRLGAGLLSPAGLVAGITGALVSMAKLGEETERTQSRIRALGGGKKAFDEINDSAKKLGTNRDNLQQGLEGFLAAKRTSQQNSKVSYAPGYQPPEDQFSANVIGGNSTNVGNRADFEAAQRTLLAGSKVDKTKTEDAVRGINDFFNSLYSNKGLVADAVRQLEKVSPADANRLAGAVGPAVGRGFPNSAALAAYLDKNQPIPTDAVLKGLAKDEPNALRDAAKSRGIWDAFEGLTAASSRLTEKFGGDHGGLTGGIDGVTKVIDSITERAEKMAKQREENSKGAGAKTLNEVFNGEGDPLGRLASYLRNVSTANAEGGNPFAKITDFFKKAAVDPGSLKERDRSGKDDKAADAQIKAASDHEKAASDHTKAAGDLTNAAKALSGAAKTGEQKDKTAISAAGGGETPSGAHGAKTGKEDENEIRFGGKTVEDFKTHSGEKFDAEVSGHGERANDIYELNRQLQGQRDVGEYEGDKANLTTKNIRDQLGLVDKDKDKPGERLFPGGPLRYRSMSDPNYQPAELGKYDDNMNFVPSKQQPYGRLRQKPYIGDQPYSPLEDTYDTKGRTFDNNPIYNFGQPQPMSFPSYLKDLRDTLPGVPLPRPKPSELQQQAPQSLMGIDSDFQKLAAVIEEELKKKKKSQESSASAFAGGGHVSGPGTTTSDSIPAMLSDGEYVIRAEAARKLGRGHLDWLNAGHFAEGGEADAYRWAMLLGDAEKRRKAALEQDPSADPNPGMIADPRGTVWNNPHLTAEESIDLVNAANLGRKKRMPKFGFASGGAVGNLSSFGDRIPHYFGGGPVSIPQLAIGGSAFAGEAPSLSDIGDGGGAALLGHLGTLDLSMGGNTYRIMSSEDTAKQMSAAARDSAVFRTGNLPSWYQDR